MTLEFHKLTQQIEQMGSYLAAREDEAADKLAQVCAVAMALPARRRGALTYPSFRSLKRTG